MFITQNLSIGHGGETFAHNINLSLDSKARKRIGIVGSNGCGKSTLLKTLAGVHDPHSGTLSFAEERVGYLPQVMMNEAFRMKHNSNTEKVILIGEYLESKLEEPWQNYLIEMVLHQVGLPEYIILQTFDTLSGGQKVRLKLAEILLAEPTILILDEPTNHLDLQGLDWFTDFLENFFGSVILVSHNRQLLTDSVHEIWEMCPQQKTLFFYHGNYDDWKTLREKRKKEAITKYQRINTEIQNIRSWLRAHEFHPKYRFSTIVASQKGKLAKLEATCPERPHEDEGIKMPKFCKPEKPSRLIKFDIKGKSFPPKKQLLKNISGKIYAGECVHVTGANGAGKTTLLRILSGEDTDFEGSVIWKENLKIQWLRQESALKNSQTVWQSLIQSCHCDDTSAYRILDHYGLKSLRESRIESLSGGQQKKLELAIILEQKPDILFLDEPTNHLDIYAQEDLERFLSAAQGLTIVFVSHDVYFARKLGSNKVIEISPNSKIRFECHFFKFP